MKTMLKGDKALLLAEGCKLKKQVKELEERLAKIREEIDIDKAGKYVNAAGDELVITETFRYSDIQPAVVLSYLKKKKMSNRFPETVKVQITPLRKVVPDSIIDKWRVELDKSYRWVWK